MDKERVVLNTMLFHQQILQDKLQSQIISDLVNNLDINRIELHREYIEDYFGELINVQKIVDLKGTEIFYSVPDNLFVDLKLNSKLVQYIYEAKLIHASKIKMTLGDWSDSAKKYVQYINKVLPDDIQLTIENDRTIDNSDVNKLLSFFQESTKKNVNVGFVNDIANWIFTSQDVMIVSKQLLKYTSYIHLRNYKSTRTGIQISSFNEGDMNWEKTIQLFAKEIPVVLEYASNTNQLKADVAHLLDSNI